jgi:phosphatidylglycerophosphatase B
LAVVVDGCVGPELVVVKRSRLLLGMHWPVDLIVATLISWLLVTFATWITQRVCGPLTPPKEEQQEIASRDPES